MNGIINSKTYVFKFSHKFLCKTNDFVKKWVIEMVSIIYNVIIDIERNVINKITVWSVIEKKNYQFK